MQKDRENEEAINTLVNNILKAIEGQIFVGDKTFKSVVKSVTDKGYVILDNTGSERTVKCNIPNVTLTVGTYVWVIIPCGKTNDMHICGVV